MIKAHIADRFWADAVDVFIVEHREGQRRHLRTSDEGWTRWIQDDEAIVDGDIKPTLTLPCGSGRTLLQALVEHYQGAEDTRALRRDYDAERKRVDDQAKVIADIARTLAQRTIDVSPQEESWTRR